MSARTTALCALIATRRQGAWSDGILKEYVQRDRLERRDAALAVTLTYGVMQNRMLLDHYLEQVVSGGLSRLQPAMLDILRLGAYQILLLDKIPDSAAVNEAVEQTKRYVNQKAAGMTNGAMQSVGESQIEPFLRADNEPAPTCLQVNPLLSNPDEVERALTEQDILFRKHPWLSGCYLVTGTGNLARLELFASGKVYVQDASAKLAAMAAGVRPFDHYRPRGGRLKISGGIQRRLRCGCCRRSVLGARRDSQKAGYPI